MFSLPELEAALSLVHDSFPGTPQYAWPLLAERSDAEVWVKHENHAPTGAFKLRGRLIYAERLRRERPHVPGIVSATRGNHGQSLAYAGRRYGVQVTVVVPHGNSVEKNAAMRAFGARLIEHGDDFEMAREEAARIASSEGLEFAPSFAPDLVMVRSCEKTYGAPEIRVLRADGQVLMRGKPEVGEMGHEAKGNVASRSFAVKVLHTAHAMSPNAEFAGSDLNAVELRVYRARDGKRLAVVRADEPAPSHDGYCLSPDGSQVAVLAGGQIDIFPVRAN